MKPEQIYQELKHLAEKLDVKVVEKNLKNIGVNVKSGLCKVKGRKIFIMDKHKSIHIKNKILAACLSKMKHEHIFVVPAVRELITSRGRTRKA